MTKVIGVRFRTAGKIYFFSPGEFEIKQGDHVIVETARGIEYGRVVSAPKEVDDDSVIQPLKSVIRIATEQDEKTVEKNVKSTQAGGTTIAVGEPLAETLRKAKGVTFEYNADYGVACNIGKVYISIPDEDITKAGLDYVNSLTSDIEPNIDFKLEYIKPSAKIKDFEIN